ncbi:MAG: hypothetical protein NTV54_04185 [Ignavibacteriales bacterium]|nr:hypothetical protein [Ignavibacteriales bacterium]
MTGKLIRLLKCYSFLFVALFFVSCGRLSTEELAIEVKKSIVETLKEEGKDETVKVKGLLLTHKSGNEYSGLLETIEDNEVAKHTVEVIYDGRSFKWEIVK